MADTTVQKRKAAPTVDSILMLNTDERKEIIAFYQKKDPSKVYKFESKDVTDYDLERRAYEKVVDNGRVVQHNGDILVWRDKELDDAVRARRQGESLEMAKKNMPKANARGELTQVAKPKVPQKTET